jgi:hypothetical protein
VTGIDFFSQIDLIIDYNKFLVERFFIFSVRMNRIHKISRVKWGVLCASLFFVCISLSGQTQPCSDLSPHIGIRSLNQPQCPGETGSVVIDTMLSLTPIEDIVWSHLEGTAEVRDSVGDLAPGTYSVTARAPNGCESTLSMVIEEPATFNRGLIRALPATSPSRPTGKLVFEVDGPEATYEVLIVPADTAVAPRRIQFDDHLKESDYGQGLFPTSYTLHNLRDIDRNCISEDAPGVAIVPYVRPE